MDTLNKIRSNITFNLEELSQGAFKRIFTHIDQLGIKQGVDKIGIDRFVEQCARLAATTGVISGGGGALTMAIGIPFDLLNMITQQFRVTLGIIYYHRGTYNVSFDEFVSILAVVFQVEAGVAITKTILERVAEKMMIRLGSKTAGRLIPIVGAVIGGSTNYLFIKRVAVSVKRLQPRLHPLTIHVE
ncbi:MAG: hypothetical protein JWP37_990 [Mucilaginibacter sp.]|nr:hypothetical protein [Mucilaginibacter sp.]